MFSNVLLSHSLSLDMLNNFCFHLYAQKSLTLSHSLISLTFSLSQQQTECSFSCTVCGKTFINTFNLKRHFKKHDGCRFFACNDCGDQCTRQNNLQVHISNHHSKSFGDDNKIHFAEKLKDFKCKFCDK